MINYNRRGQKKFLDLRFFSAYSITSLFAIVSALLCSKMTLRIVTFAVAIIGAFLYPHIFSMTKKNNRTSPGVTYWFTLLALVASITSTLTINVNVILAMTIIASLIIWVFKYRGVQIRCFMSLLSIVVFTVVITNSTNYIFSKSENAEVIVIDKYEVSSHVSGASSKDYILDVVKDGDDIISSIPVSVSEETYCGVEIGKKIELIERTGILTQSMTDPRIDSARVLDNWTIGKYEYSDHIVIIGLTLGLILYGLRL